jgi:hypothetical protein
MCRYRESNFDDHGVGSPDAVVPEEPFDGGFSHNRSRLVPIALRGESAGV